MLFFMMTILAPVVFYLLFAYGFCIDAKHIMLGVVDFDKTAMSRSLIDTFVNATDLFDLKMVTDNYAPVERELALGNLRVALVIPNDFEIKIKTGRKTQTQALIDAAYPNTASLVGANADAILGVFRYEVLYKYLATRPSFEGGGGLTFTPIDLSASGWYNSAFRSEDFIIPAIIALVIVFFPPMVGAMSLAREKETGSILNMYCSSLRKTEYLMGKMTPYILITYFNFIVFLIMTVFLFDVPMRGSVATLCIGAFFYIAVVIAVGLFVAVLVKSQVAAILITFVGTVMPAFLFCGFMVPMSSMDKSAQQTGYTLPTTYFIDMTRKLMVKGVSFKYVATDMYVLIISAVALYAICIKLFKKRLG